MRIAMVVDGTRGDVQPMLVLGAALAAEGHSVRICAPPDFRSAAVSAGLEFHAVGKNVRAYLTDHAEAIDGNALKALLEGLRYSRDSVRTQFETLPDATAATAARRLRPRDRLRRLREILLHSRRRPREPLRRSCRRPWTLLRSPLASGWASRCGSTRRCWC